MKTLALPLLALILGSELLPFALRAQDSKELIEPVGEADMHSSGFQPLPPWSSFSKMPPLPDQLKPLGRKPAAVVVAKKDSPAAPNGPATTAASLAPPPKPNPTPDPVLTAVSPFLEWVKTHPSQAAVQAHKDADAYQSPVSAPAAPSTAGANAPYWMPPINEAPETTTAQPNTTAGSSAAIYSTPQRD